jgi:hypothetical protein
MLKLVKLDIATFGLIKMNKISQVEMNHNFGSQKPCVLLQCYN